MSRLKKKLASEFSNDSPAQSSKDDAGDKNSKVYDKRTGWCRQKFREDWCSESQFEGWLEEVPDDPFRAWCKCCQCTLLVGRSELLKHSATKKHKRAFEEFKIGNNAICLMDGKLFGSTGTISNKTIDEAVLRAELRFAAFAVDHNLSVNAIEHLGNLMNVFGERLDVLPKLKMDSSRCSTIVCQVLMKSIEQELEEVLKSNGYSLIVEEVELSDPGRRAFIIIVRYFNELKNKTWNQLLGTIIVSDQDLQIKSLWKMVSELLTNLKVPVNNLVAVAADYSIPLFDLENLSDLKTGDYLQTNMELVAQGSNTQLFRFNSNSILSVMWSAVNTLPEGLESLMHHFGSLVTGQLKHVYRITSDDVLSTTLQEVASYETRKHFQSLRPSEWLINSTCNAMLAQCLPLLISFLEKRVVESESAIANALLREATNPYSKAYFLFLSYILSQFEVMHSLLRSTNVSSYRLIKDFLTHFRGYCQHFIAPAVGMVSDLTKIDLEDEKNLLPEKSIFVGKECQEYLKEMEEDELTTQFMGQCRRFLQVAAIQILNRIPMNDVVLNMLTFMDPSVAFSSDGRVTIPNLQPLSVKFPILLASSKLDEQWDALPTYFSTSDVEELKKLPVDTMWGVVGDVRNDQDVLVFGALGRLAKIMLSLPIPDVDVVTLTKMVTEVTTCCYSDEEMKSRLEMVPLKHSMMRSNIDCYQQRVTMKNRKLYLLNVNKKEDFPETRYLFRDDNQ
ncbi:hypothetical protein CHUAL_014242 [Chamberlinius hualienensis]